MIYKEDIFCTRGDKMKITDLELNIEAILHTHKGRIEPSRIECASRHSDCFVYVLSGEAEYLFGDRSVTAREGSVIYLAKGSRYSINVSDDNYTFIFTDFNFSNPSNEIFENEIYSTKEAFSLSDSFEKLYTFWKLGDFSERIYCKSIIYKIYSEIAKLSTLSYISRDKRALMKRMAEYISENIGNSELNVSSLSLMCGVSEVHFRRLFSSLYGTSPIKFITAARIKKAKELLMNTDNSIASVAEECGFENHYYFSKIFKCATNKTPGEFRRLYKSSF